VEEEAQVEGYFWSLPRFLSKWKVW
jgi:hypothetical protein